MALLHKLRQFAALSRAERSVLIRALTMLPLVDAQLRLRGWRHCHQRLVAWARRQPPLEAGRRLAPERVSWLVDRAARSVPRAASCLRRSLVLWALLERSGTPCSLRLGVRKKETGAIEIHAWVELDGVPLNERRDVRRHYAVFDEALAPGNWREA